MASFKEWKKRVLWITLSLGLLALGAVFLISPGKLPSGDTPRHLVLVVLDTLRADRMSIYGHSRPTTPFLDGISSQLLLFEDLKSPSPWTVPSHASLFTGLWPSVHKAQWGRAFLGREHATLAEVLAREGFVTLGFSANPFIAKKYGFAQGFQHFRRVKGSWRSRSERLMKLLPKALDKAKPSSRRVFLFVNLMDTHIPYNARRYGKVFGVQGSGPVADYGDKWRISAGEQEFGEEDKRLHQAAYDAAVRYLDDLMRDLFALLREKNMLEHSLVVLVSDHGDGLGAHKELGHSISVWEEQLAVPLILRFPGGRRGGERISRRSSLVALMPSLLRWLDIPLPSILAEAPGLEEFPPEEVRSDYRNYFSELVVELNRKMADLYPELAARTRHTHVLYCGQNKLIVRAEGAVEFYDLDEDPKEQKDLARHAAPEFETCRKRYESFRAKGFYTPFGEKPSKEERAMEGKLVDPEMLRSLGYLN